MAIRIDVGTKWVLALAVCLSLIQATATAQFAPQSDSRTSGYAPPVHIPPRVPLYDPGLPETLNGKFNSTHQIRSGWGPGEQRAVIGDLDQQSWSPGGVDGDATQYGTDSYGKPIQTGGLRQTAHDGRGQRRPGLQDKFSQMMAGTTPPRRGGTVQARQTASTQQPTRQRLQQSIDSTVNSFSPKQRLVAQGQSRQLQPGLAVNPQQPTGTGYRPPFVRSNGNANVQPHSIAGPHAGLQVVETPNPQLPQRQQPPIAQRQAPIQTAGLQRFEDQDVEMVEPIQSTTDGSNPRPVQSQPFDEQDFIAQNFDSSDEAFRKTKPSTGDRISRFNAAQQAKAKAISVLNARDGELSLEAPGDMGGVGLESADSFEAADSPNNQTFRPVRGNLLRQPRRKRQEDDPLQVSPQNGDLDDMESKSEDSEDEGLADEGDDEDDDDDSENPLNKSCDEFRSELLNVPITDIALDISPPGKTEIFGDNTFRVWRDQRGNELAQGTISDLRRGYLVVNANNGLVRLPYSRLSEADLLAVAEYWRLPNECGLGDGVYSGRCWTPQTATWHASSLCHKPLYFENVQLERYGHTHGPFLQPVASTAHFFTRLFFLPYNTAINPPNECQYALGFYRPGNCAPWLRDPFPISLSGATRQGLIYTGAGFLTQ